MFLIREHFLKTFGGVKNPNHQQYFVVVWTMNFQKYLENGGRYRARTSDPLLVRQVLSQLS